VDVERHERRQFRRGGEGGVCGRPQEGEEDRKRGRRRKERRRKEEEGRKKEGRRQRRREEGKKYRTESSVSHFSHCAQ